MTEDAEYRIDRVSLGKTIKNKLSKINFELEAVYKKIYEIFAIAQSTQCFSPECKKNEKNKNVEREKIYLCIDYLITDFYEHIVSTMNIINVFNSQTIEKYYEQGTTSQLICVNMLYKSFNLAFFQMLKAFEYIKNEEDVFVLQPERISKLYRSHKRESDYYIACIKEQEQYDASSFFIHSFLVPARGFYVHHFGDCTILFNNAQIIKSSGILINELRNVNAMEKRVNEYQVCEVGEFLPGNLFGRKDLVRYKSTERMQHSFASFDLSGEDSFGKKFGYIQNHHEIDVLVEEILYLESLIKNVQDVHAIAKSKDVLTDEECKAIEACITLARPEISKALGYAGESHKSLSFVEVAVKYDSSSSSEVLQSSQIIAQNSIRVLEECHEQLEQAMNQCKKGAYDYYEKQIIAEQERVRVAVASGKIYENTKKAKSYGRGKHQLQSKKIEKKESGAVSKKEKEALSHKALAFLEEHKVRASIKKRELDLLAKQMMKQLDPQKIVKIQSNIDGSHEVFHAEGAESVTYAGHGNNPEYSASAANQFLMNRARQLEISRRFVALKKTLESNR